MYLNFSPKSYKNKIKYQPNHIQIARQAIMENISINIIYTIYFSKLHSFNIVKLNICINSMCNHVYQVNKKKIG